MPAAKERQDRVSNRKRGQGEGSIYQRRDGRWVAQISLINGRKGYVYATTAADARLKLLDAKRRMAESRPVKDDTRTVRQVCDAWLSAKEGTVRPKTQSTYSDLLRKHAFPHLGNIRLNKLRVTDLEALYRSCQAAPKTVRNLHFVLKAALAWAERRDWIARNPADYIAPEDLPRVQRQQIAVLSPAEARALIAAATDTKSEALVVFALMTGARVGEIMGLTWDRTDLDRGRAHIAQGLQYFNGQPVLTEPKTRAAVRELTLPAPVIAALKVHRAAQNSAALKLGQAWGNRLNLVFTTETGQPLNRHAVLRQYFRPVLKRAGLPETLRFHDLRHGAASLLLSQGVPVPVVSEMLGHANPAITMAIYSHALPDSQRVAALAMESVFGGD